MKNRAKILEFRNYFLSFYSEKGLYPIKKLTEKDIYLGLSIRLLDRPDLEFDGDTSDRELVRDIILTWRTQ